MNAIFAVCLLSATTNSAVWEPLVLKEHYGQALQSARSHGRPLVLVMQDSSDPHHPLQQIKQVSDKVDRELLDQFELCRVDVTTPHGKKTARAFGAEKFPYTVLIGNKGKKIVFRRAGPMAPEDWQNTLASHQTTQDPSLSGSAARSFTRTRADVPRRLRATRVAPRACKR